MKEVKKVAVIGAGPAGVAFAKALLKEKNVTVKLYERRDTFGGLWNYSKDELKSSNKLQNKRLPQVPLVDPFKDWTAHNRYEKPVIGPGGSPVWHSPMYKYLDTNTPKGLMEFKDTPFSESTPLYPDRAEVLQYLRDYSEDIRPLVSFNTIVDSVEFINGKGPQVGRKLSDISWDQYQWKVSSSKVVSAHGVETKQDSESELFDAVAVASGNYNSSYIPDFEGLSQWFQNAPESIVHAKDFDDPQDFANESKILVVGNSASGVDISTQISSSLPNVTVYKSHRNASSKYSLPTPPNLVEKPNIAKFDHATNSIHFVDGSVVQGVSKVIFATGYLRSYPFLQSLSTPYLDSFKSTADSISKDLIQPLLSNGQKVNGLYQHIVSYQWPGLACIGLPRYILPARTSETQGAWLARLWAGKIKLPSIKEMQKWELDQYNKVDGLDYKFHSLDYPVDIDYYNFFNSQILSSASPGEDVSVPFVWDDYSIKLRGQSFVVRVAYLQYMKETGKKATTVDELIKAGYLTW